MLDLINRYAHGFVAIPTILACRERGLFGLLEEGGAMTSRQLAHELDANEGHLCVALRLFERSTPQKLSEVGKAQRA